MDGKKEIKGKIIPGGTVGEDNVPFMMDHLKTMSAEVINSRLKYMLANKSQRIDDADKEIQYNNIPE